MFENVLLLPKDIREKCLSDSLMFSSKEGRKLNSQCKEFSSRDLTLRQKNPEKNSSKPIPQH